MGAFSRGALGGTGAFRKQSVTGGGSTTGAFVPTSLGRLAAWHRADYGVTLEAGNKVSVWADRSGNGHTLTQGTDATRPVWVAGQLNGRPIIRSTTATQMNYTAWAQNTACQVFVVGRHASSAARQKVLRLSAAGETCYWSNTSHQAELFDGSVLLAGTAKTAGTAYVVSWAWDFATGTGNIDQWVGLNGGTEASRDSTAETLSNWAGFGQTGSEEHISDVAEIIIYNRRLTASEATAVRGYLRSWYALY